MEGDTRTTTLADKTELTETLRSQADDRYAYSGSGDQRIADYEGVFVVSGGDDEIALTWSSTFTPADAEATVRMFSIFAAAASSMTEVLSNEFTPMSEGPS